MVAETGCKLLAQTSQVDEAIDGTQKMVGGNVGLERELIEHGTLLDLPRSHHLLQLPPLNRSESSQTCLRNSRVFQQNRS